MDDKIIHLNNSLESIVAFVDTLKLKVDEEDDDGLKLMVEDIQTLCNVVVEALEGKEVDLRTADAAEIFIGTSRGPKS